VKRILLSAGVVSALILVVAADARANTYAVTSTADNGPNTLRAAIVAANGHAGADLITFAIGSGAKTISLTASLPDVIEAVTLDGASQPGFTGVPLIRIDGVGLAADTDCLRLFGGNSVVKNLMITRCPGDGLALGGGTAHQIYGNYLGTDGTTALGNGTGLDIYSDSSDNLIGGVNANQRNVISGNVYGVYMFGGSSSNVIVNNYVGTNAAGTAAIANTYAGLRVLGNVNSIGGTNPNQRNVISGNTRYGLTLEGTGNGNIVQGNYIGTNAAGSAALGNLDAGIDVSGATGSNIGGSVAGAANLISGNAYGLVLSDGAANTQIIGNRIGTNPTGSIALPNTAYGIRVLQASGTVIGTAATGNVISGNLNTGIYVQDQASGTQIINNRIGTDASGMVDVGNGGDGVAVGGVNTVLGSLAAGNVISGNASNGISVNADAISPSIVNNRVGTTANGLAALGNDAYGLRLLGGSNVVIGGVGLGNVFSGNGRGVIFDYGNGGVQFKGNIVGLKSDQSGKLPNHEYGLSIGTPGNQIGGTAAGERNVIAANDDEGIALLDGAVGNHIEGNYIGTNTNLAAGLGNGYAGIETYRAHDNVIGGTAANAGNVITGSYAHGVYQWLGNGNAVLGNRIYGNGRSDMELDPIGPDLNDALDADAGPNLGQNYPVLTLAQSIGGNLSLNGVLKSAPSASYRVEYFHSTQCHPSGFGGGEEFIGFTNVSTDAAGSAVISDMLLGGPSTGVITAMATDAGGNTSEFSPCVAIGAASAGTLNISRDPVLAYEDESQVTIAVTRSLGFAGSVSVTLVTQNGIATAPADFTAQNKLLTFAPGEVLKLVSIPLVLDNTVEGNEVFTIALQNPTGGAALGSNDSVQALLFDHDPAFPFVNVSDVSVTEPVNGTVQAVFHVTSSGSDHPLSLSFFTFDGTAKAGSDYTAKTGSLNFAVGETDKTVSVTVLSDAALEGSESFFLHVTGGQDFIADRLDGEATVTNTGGSDTIFADGFQTP
jgi:hypothetical protein